MMKDQYQTSYYGHFSLYRGLEKIGGPESDDSLLLDPKTGMRLGFRFRVEAPEGYPQYCDGLEIGAIYSAADCIGSDVMDEGLTYFAFLDKLGEMVGHDEMAPNPTHNPPPFFELLRFAFQRGHMGPEVAEKLRRDFEEWRDVAKTYAGDWFWRKYYNEEIRMAEGTVGLSFFNGALEDEPYLFRRWVRLARIHHKF